jgi:valyl-tRNA synthetase
LWWGQQIPAFKCTSKSDDDQIITKWFCAQTIKDAKLKAIQNGSKDDDNLTIEQDEDVLDTWFTSTLLPLAIFGWPSPQSKSDDDQTIFSFKNLYPTNILETGFDIM